MESPARRRASSDASSESPGRWQIRPKNHEETVVEVKKELLEKEQPGDAKDAESEASYSEESSESESLVDDDHDDRDVTPHSAPTPPPSMMCPPPLLVQQPLAADQNRGSGPALAEQPTKTAERPKQQNQQQHRTASVAPGRAVAAKVEPPASGPASSCTRRPSGSDRPVSPPGAPPPRTAPSAPAATAAPAGAAVRSVGGAAPKPPVLQAPVLIPISCQANPARPAPRLGADELKFCNACDAALLYWEQLDLSSAEEHTAPAPAPQVAEARLLLTSIRQQGQIPQTKVRDERCCVKIVGAIPCLERFNVLQNTLPLQLLSMLAVRDVRVSDVRSSVGFRV